MESFPLINTVMWLEVINIIGYTRNGQNEIGKDMIRTDLLLASRYFGKKTSLKFNNVIL